jgi:hypothetical protein
MNVRFKKTDKGEVAILRRKNYEPLAAKAQEADEDFDTARLVVRARKEVAAGMPLIPKKVDRIAGGENALCEFLLQLLFLSFSTESATSVTALSIYQAGSEKGDDGEGGVVYLGMLLLATCNDNGSSSATHTAINCLSNAGPSVADPPKWRRPIC